MKSPISIIERKREERANYIFLTDEDTIKDKKDLEETSICSKDKNFVFTSKTR